MTELLKSDKNLYCQSPIMLLTYCRYDTTWYWKGDKHWNWQPEPPSDWVFRHYTLEEMPEAILTELVTEQLLGTLCKFTVG